MSDFFSHNDDTPAESNPQNENAFNQVQLFHNGDEYFKAYIEAIESARECVTLESYIFKYDQIGKRVLDALVEAKKRNVKVKLMVDGIGSFWWVDRIKEICNENQIKLKVYHFVPTKWRHWLRFLHFGFFVEVLKFVKTLNKRNHRKVLTVDKKIAFIGSYNICAEHSEEYLGPMAWRDSGAKVTGPTADELYKLFQYNFTPRWKRKPVRINLKNLRSNHTTMNRFRLQQDFLSKIKNAQSHVYITTPYFLPKKVIMQRLIEAAKRGVDVKIILPQITDVELLVWARFYFLKKLIQNKIKIYLYKPRLLHAKYTIIDNWATMGSHNLNHRSLLHDLEVDLVFIDELTLYNLKKQFNIDLEQSDFVSDIQLDKISIFEKIMCRMTLFLRYWL